MLPLQLSLQNFMCYRGESPSLDFRGMRLACLCGDNGHGKSALLDAMTWALWGRSRAGAQADPLVHAGESEMAVTFDFLAQDAEYRVLRRHAKPRGRARSGQTSLDLLLRTETGYVSTSGDSQRETQRKIVELLRLDYETFVNSAFLVQGNADRFTVAPPAERKNVLAEILSLSLYDRLEESARRRRGEAESRMRSLDFLLQDAERQLAEREGLQDQVSQEQARSTVVESSLREAEARLTALLERQTRLAYMQEQAEELRKRRESLGMAKQETEIARSAAQSRLRAYEAVLAQAESIAHDYQQLQDVRRRFQEQASRATRYAELTSRRVDLERAVHEARTPRESELRWVESQATEARTVAQTANDLLAERTRLQEELATLAARQQEVEGARQRSQDLGAAIQSLRDANRGLRREMQDLRGKVDLLETGQAVCPLCGTAIGEEGLAHVRAEYESQGRALAERYRANQAQADAQERGLQDLQAAVQKQEADLRHARSAAEQRLAVVGRDLARAADAAQRLSDLDDRQAALREELDREAFAQAEREQLAVVVAELATLDYQPEAHQELEQRLHDLTPAEEHHRQLEEARTYAPREREASQAAETRLAQISAEETALGERLGRWEQELVGQDTLKGELANAREQVEQQRKLREETTARVARLLAEIERLAALEAQQTERREDLRRVAEERDVYAELVTAFGKQGIQALLIETALPEIEEEANDLLARMTEGRMSLRLETQRETRQGATRETLEVYIGDEWGTRPYEMYSGGEAFRINLALRIGLSRLLARRSGAPLPVLFIDEGFGTQDAQGRDRIVDALSAIQDQFDLILIITHIQELKEMFPVRIEVEKSGEGSTFSVVA